jgi:hypothetical protein
LLPGDHNGAEFQRFVRDKVRIELEHKQRLGENPDVFSFQFTDPDPFGLYLLHTRFYGGLDVFTAMLPEQSKLPFNLGMALMNDGIRTTITLGADEYHFNLENSDSQPAG